MITAEYDGFNADIHLMLDAWSGYDDAACEQAASLLRQILPAKAMSNMDKRSDKGVLTGDGFPLEMSFSGLDQSLRLTMDVMPNRYTPGQRLSAAVAFLERDQGQSVPQTIIRVMMGLQRSERMSYGAWLGVRLRQQGTQFKLYSEVNIPDIAEQYALLASLGITIPVRSCESLRVRMLAYNLASGAVEVYLRGQNVGVYELPQLLSGAGLAARADELSNYIGRLYGHTLSSRLPGQSIGVSYVHAAQESKRAVCLFMPARQFWGSDRRCRAKLLLLLPSEGGVCNRYRSISRPLKYRNGCLTHHGMLGIVLAEAMPAQLNIGLRPWAGGIQTADHHSITGTSDAA